MKPSELYAMLDKTGCDWQCTDADGGLRQFTIMVEDDGSDDDFLDEVEEARRLSELAKAWFVEDYIKDKVSKGATINDIDKFMFLDALEAYDTMLYERYLEEQNENRT
tara:strand:+ start:533 stop:856 length:324 start_codon:yes stop_codon:yes gene_type:complete